MQASAMRASLCFFDRRFGLIRALQALPQERFALTLTGHSQGAAMAALLHAFLRNAAKANWPLAGKNVHLASYVFAQPKPVDALFSADFDQVSRRNGNSFVVNNALDPVPAVPLTKQSLADYLSKDLPPTSRIDKFIDAIEAPGRYLRRGPYSQLDCQIIALMGSDDLLLDPKHHRCCRAEACKFPAGSSRNDTMARTLVSLVGDPSGAYRGQDRNDPFIQHHARSYREHLGKS